MPSRASPTLAQHFEAPEDHFGCFGWICGYSADAEFLNTAAELFTRQTQAQRASLGNTTLALMLDPGNPAISFIDTPGVAHLPIRTLADKPFALLHAKVALLGFRHQSDAACWTARLIVSTGNWTRQTMEESLDLAWCIDVRSDQLEAADTNGTDDTDIQQRCADVKAAHTLLSSLAQTFDTRILQARAHAHPSDTAIAMSRLDAWLSLCAKHAGKIPPRFFDNQRKSLLSQLGAKIRNTGAAVQRNSLAMGSGYYETAATPGHAPTVLTDIVALLQAEGLLTGSPWLDVFVNADACQAVAQSVEALTKEGFKVRAAGQPKAIFGAKSQRTLHAKFLFSANYRRDSNNCSSAWLYLGSGNLTKPGFTAAMRPRAGNLEAGVVFAPQPLLWDDLHGSHREQAVTNVLPVQWESELKADAELTPGGDMPDRSDQYIAPPAAWLLWNEVDTAAGLLTSDHGTADFDVLDPTSNACAKAADGFLWPDSRPRQVTVRWTDGGQARTAEVPVVDPFGRIAATALPQLDLTEAWWQLASFPMPPDNEGDASADDGQEAGNARRRTPSSTRPSVASYPVRDMMQLIEQLAARQTLIDESDWAAWCCRLEQTLMRAAESHALQVFRELALNPLSPLKAAPFRPDFAELVDTPAGQVYEAVLTRIEQAWQVDGLPAIGAQQ
ncbi:hypothetical protein [Cupriavidus sp. D39]|uniref:hypothetical protein n=1 Tax=Cupriavidus sp. D39 TaxID=2997877 RepID=UPI0022710F81|nr:hypothetical protein [Cupriavidus sp. D39]MCY0854023.1 hypothetical protein [Cupriavidus sp. D39]